MNNLQWLYQTDETFRKDVCASCAKWLGSTSTNFADAWLRETHRSDYEDLTGQHAGVDGLADMEERIETQRQTIGFYADELHKAQAIAEKYRADAIAAQKERDSYRELCGRMRKMANDMLCMEVD